MGMASGPQVWHAVVNLDTHCPLVLLPGREQRTLAVWFKKYPEIQVVSRDRGGIYALAARDGAPQAGQVADLWHLLKNIGDALERMMYRHMPLIRQVATELSKNRMPKRLWYQSQHYVILSTLNSRGVTNGINAGLRSSLFIKRSRDQRNITYHRTISRDSSSVDAVEGVP